MKKTKSFSWFNPLKTIGLELLLLLLFFISFSIVHAQNNYISRSATDYPDGIVPGIPVPCALPYVVADLDCIIYLKPAVPGVDYEVTIPVQGGINRADLEFDISPYGSCTSGNVNCSTDGIITMSASSICEPNTGESFIDFNISVINLNNGNEDQQRYRIPILRTPVKVVLVLDRSGSMNGTVPGGTEKRWDVLKKSVWEFVAQLELHQQFEDSIGLTYFMTYVIQPGMPIEDKFAYINASNAPELVSDTINYLMGLQTPYGMTALGNGLKDAKSKLNGNSPIGATKIVLLFTDGYQNQYPRVQNDGRTLEDLSLLNDGPVDVKDSIKYYTIGMGTSSSMLPYLSAIAASNSGVFLHTITGDFADFEYFFDNQFSDMLSNGSPQIIDRQIGKLVNGKSTHTFHLNTGISQAIFKVSHTDGDNLNIKIEKGGFDYTPSKIITSSFLKMCKIKFPIVNDEKIYSAGDWNVTISGDSNNDFYVTCIADDHLLDYTIKTDKPIYISGEYIDLIADFSFAGEALSKSEDSVKVIILKPGDDLGHLLATYTLPENEIDYANEELTPDEQKLLSLLSDENLYNKLLPENQIIKLQHIGNGIYKGRFEQTEISGVYQAIYKFKGEKASIGIFNREKLKSIVVENGNFISENITQINDITPPTSPSNITFANITSSSVDMHWNNSFDNVGVKNYAIYKNGEFVANSKSTTYHLNDLEPLTTYSFYIIAKDYANIGSVQSEEVNFTTLEIDQQAPTKPLNLAVFNITQTNLNLTWNASTDNVDVAGYTIYKNNEVLGNTESNSFLVTELTPGTNYSFYIKAYDEAANQSEKSNTVNVTSLNIPIDISAPTKLTPSNITQYSIELNWNASQSNSGNVEYNIYKNGLLIGTTSSVAYRVLNLKALTEYTFHVIARDSEGNNSDASNTATATTLKETQDIDNGFTILTIRPKNKFGYYLGPGFKQKISFKYIPKALGKTTSAKSSIDNNDEEISNNPDPYLKEIKDNLDGSYYLIVANVLPKTNPNILITIGDEEYYKGPINGKIPFWFYVLIIVVLLIIFFLRKSKSKVFISILYIILLALIIIIYLHKTGFLNFI